MRITLDFERYTDNFSVYSFKKGDKICSLYLPKIVTCRKQPFELIVSSKPNPEAQADKDKISQLERELAEARRRLNAIRNLA